MRGQRGDSEREETRRKEGWSRDGRCHFWGCQRKVMELPNDYPRRGAIAAGVIESFITEGVKGSSRGTRTVNITNAGMNKIRLVMSQLLRR